MDLLSTIAADTLKKAGFQNYSEPNLVIQKGQKTLHVHHVSYPENSHNRLNVVVIEKQRFTGEGMRRPEIYFGTFLGQYSNDLNGQGEYAAFVKKIRRLATEKNRVEGKDLGLLLLNALEVQDEKIKMN